MQDHKTGTSMLLDKYLGGRLRGKQKFYAILIVAAVLLITSALRYYNFPRFARGVTKLIHLYFFWFFIKKNTTEDSISLFSASYFW